MFTSKKSFIIAAIFLAAVCLIGTAKAVSAATDFEIFNSCWLKDAAGDCVKADFDKNGFVGAPDFNLLKTAISTYDLNGDNIVNLATSTNIILTDFTFFNSCWLKYTASTTDCVKADFDKNGFVGAPDFNLLKAAISAYDLNGDGVVNIATAISITVASPNGGEVWHPGETHRIKWDYIGGSSVKIYIYDSNISGSGSINYITPNGSAVENIGYYDWTIPAINQLPGGGSGNYKIKVDDANNSAITDLGDKPLSIKTSVINNINIVYISKDFPTIKWETNQNFRGYVWYRKKGSTSDNDWQFKVSDEYKKEHALLLNSLNYSTSYEYHITALDEQTNMIDKSEVKFFTTPSFEKETPVCTDSDSGKNYYIKGYVTDNINSEKRQDSCSVYSENSDGTSSYKFVSLCEGANCFITEFFCGIADDNKYYAQPTQYKCPNGCSNGVCLNINSSNKITVLSPNGGEVYKIEKDAAYKSGNEITIKWQGGKEIVQIGLVKGSVTESNITSSVITWVDTKVDLAGLAGPDSSLIWNGKTVCDLDGTNCRDIYGQFKIVAISKSTLGNFIVNNVNSNGDIANFDLSDNYFTTVKKDEDKKEEPKDIRYSHVKWECADGTHFEKEDGNSCKTETTWKNIAKNSCKNSEIKEFEIEKKCSDNFQDIFIDKIHSRANDLSQNKLDIILMELNQLRDTIKEQKNEIKYLKTLIKNVKVISQNAQDAINNFITYGVDDNTKKLGEGERAAVMNSFKAAYNKLPETDEELADAIKIANGRWPSITNDEAEKKAKEQFIKIYKRIADMNKPSDSAAIKVMAYGLRQKAQNRNLNSEKSGINTFRKIYGYQPKSTEDWNTMQAITYSGAKRMADADKDLLSDELEEKLGTDPNKADTDGDGHKDGIEVNGGYDPLVE